MAGCHAVARRFWKAMCAARPACFGTGPDPAERTLTDAENITWTENVHTIIDNCDIKPNIRSQSTSLVTTC